MQSKNSITTMKWNEHIRLRPGMYIGSIDTKGFSNLLIQILSNILYKNKPSSIEIKLIDEELGIITVKGINLILSDNWSNFNQNELIHFLHLQTLNVLSSKFEIELFDENKTIQNIEKYSKGVKNFETQNKIIEKYSVAIFKFSLDKTIWGDKFKLNKDYINFIIQEFSFLHKNITFILNQSITDNFIYNFKNGLQDKTKNESFIKKINLFNNIYIDTILDEFKIELSLGFYHNFYKDQHINSYVNDIRSIGGGDHIKGVLSGIKTALKEFTQNKSPDINLDLSLKNIKKHIYLELNLIIQKPIFHGATRDKLVNKKIKKTISSYIHKIMLQELNNVDNASLIQLFEKHLY